MDITREIVYRHIVDAVRDVTGIEITSENTHLLDTKLGILPENFLYIFEILEQRLKYQS